MTSAAPLDAPLTPPGILHSFAPPTAAPALPHRCHWRPRPSPTVDDRTAPCSDAHSRTPSVDLFTSKLRSARLQHPRELDRPASPHRQYHDRCLHTAAAASLSPTPASLRVPPPPAASAPAHAPYGHADHGMVCRPWHGYLAVRAHAFRAVLSRPYLPSRSTSQYRATTWPSRPGAPPRRSQRMCRTTGPRPSVTAQLSTTSALLLNAPLTPPGLLSSSAAPTIAPARHTAAPGALAAAPVVTSCHASFSPARSPHCLMVRTRLSTLLPLERHCHASLSLFGQGYCHNCCPSCPASPPHLHFSGISGALPPFRALPPQRSSTPAARAHATYTPSAARTRTASPRLISPLHASPSSRSTRPLSSSSRARLTPA